MDPVQFPMLRVHRSPARRLAEPRGATLIICLMLMLITAILAGIILFLARSESSISATARASLQAANAADYGIQFGFSRIDSTGRSNTSFGSQYLTVNPFGPRVTDGLRDGSQAGPLSLGRTRCPEGTSLTFDCGAWRITATGWSRGWLGPLSSTQIESVFAVWQGSCGTAGEFNC